MIEKNNGGIIMKTNGFGKKGWLLIIYCLIAYYVATAFKDSMSIAVFKFVDEYGWNQTFLLSLASIGQYVACIVCYIGGLLSASGKLKARHMGLFMGLLYAITIGLWGLIPNLTVFTINYIIMTVGYFMWTQFANSTICANWFPKKSGAVMGWTTIGFPLAAATSAMLFNGLNQVMSFKNVYILFGVITFIVTVWGFFGFTDYPEESGFYPDNDTSMGRKEIEEFAKKQAEIEAKSIWTAKKMLKVKETWIIGISAGVLFLVASGSMGQMIVRFISGGMELELAIQIMGVVGFSSIIGSWYIGKLDTKYGTKEAFIGTLLTVAAACISYSISSVPTMIIGAIFIGIGLGGASNFNVSLVSYYWGRNNFKKAYGTILTIISVVGGSGALFVAVTAAKYSYTVTYIIMTVLLLISVFLVAFLKEGCIEKYETEAKEQLQV